MAYLSHLGDQEPAIYYGVWALAELGLLIVVGADVWKYMMDKDNRILLKEPAVSGGVSQSGRAARRGG